MAIKMRQAWVWRKLNRQPSRSLAVVIFVLVLTMAWPWATAPASIPRERLLEKLQFRVEYLLWKDVARAQLTLTSLGNGRYRAEISGEPLGMLKLLTGPRRDSYQTEMIWRGGRLVPLVYREESRKKHQHYLKEYRFDYAKGRLDLWQLKEDTGVMFLKWHTALKGSISDMLTAFYNCRLGLLGPVRDGQTFKLTGIPYPKPEEIEVRVGPETKEGRKVMVSINNEAFKNDRGVIFAYLDDSRVPKQAWTDSKLGAINGMLLPGGKPLHGRLPESAGTGQ
jgi:Protein of unknown function (DUF3108)